MQRGPFGYLNAMSEAVPGAKFVKGVGQAAFGAAQGKLESLRKENPKAFDVGMDRAPKGKYDEYKNVSVPMSLPSDAGKGKNRFEKSDNSTSTSEWDDDTKGNVGMDTQKTPQGKAKGGAVKMASGGSVSASSRADGCAQRGKTKGRMC